MNRLAAAFALFFSSCIYAYSEPETWIAKFTTRYHEDGKAGTAFFMNTVICQKSLCSWSILSMNQCVGEVMYPKAEEFSTASESLTIKYGSGDSVDFTIDLMGNGKISGMIELERERPGCKFCSMKVKQFSASLVKKSIILGGKLLNIPIKIEPSNPKGLPLACTRVLND